MQILQIESVNEQSNLNKFRKNPIKYLARQYGKFFLIPKLSSIEVPIPLITANNINNTHQEQDTRKFRRWPFFILMISAVQLFVFNYDLVQTNEHKSELPVEHVGLSLNGSALRLLIFNPYRSHEFWRYLTYIFVHIGFFHLVGNLMAQIFLGMPLEIMYGWWRILLLYMASVISAAVFASYYEPTKYLAGASGGVYALYGAHIANLLNNWKQIYSPALQLMIFVVVGLFDLYRIINNNNLVTSYECHAVGAVVGFLFGLVLNKKLKRILLRRLVLTQFWKYFIAAIFLIAVIYITYQNYFNSVELNILSSVAETSATSLNSIS